MKITAVVLAKNEEKNIEKCLKSVSWCDEIIVIDDCSTDQTVHFAKKFNAKIYKHSLNNDFSQQRNFGLEKANGDWVFFVDADEVVSLKLAEEIKEKNKNSEINGYFLKRIDFFEGKWLKYGEIGGVKLLRLARKNSGKFERKVDEIWRISGKTKILKNPLLHFSHESLEQLLGNICHRSELNAEEFISQIKYFSFFEWLKPLAKFIQNYFFKLGFLDGLPGFVFAVLMSFHSFLVRGRIYLFYQKKIDKKEKSREVVKIVFLVFAFLIFSFYYYLLLQKGLQKWLKLRF